jgi:hypothetical protein
MTKRIPSGTVHPLAGVLAGFALIASCLVLPVYHLVGQLSLAGPLFTACIVSRPSPRKFLRLLGGAVIVYLPMLLILPPASVLQGAATTLVAVIGPGMMGYPALHDAVTWFPMPAFVKLLLLQILHQSSVLFRETVKIREAMVVRGAIPRGLSGWRLLHALPRVWIPRVIFKADRVAHAMELRGYGTLVPPLRPMSWDIMDVIVVSASAGVFATAVGLRWTLQ